MIKRKQYMIDDGYGNVHIVFAFCKWHAKCIFERKTGRKWR